MLRQEQARRRREDAVANARLCRSSDAPGGFRLRGRGRHAHPALHVLPPVPHRGLADRPHAARPRRAHDGRGRPGAPRSRGHRDPPHHPGEADHQGERRPVPPAVEGRARRAARSRPPRPLPHLQRGLREHLRGKPSAPRPLGRGHPTRAHGAPPAARRSRGCRAPRAHAPHRCPACSADRPARRARSDGRAGSEPLGPRRDQRGDRARERRPRPGGRRPYLLQAAIAAVHDRSPTAEATDWARIEVLYERLASLSDNPVVTLNRAVAVAMARGPAAGLELLAAVEADKRVAEDHRLHAVRAHLLELLGRAGRSEGGVRGRGDAHGQPRPAALPSGASGPAQDPPRPAGPRRVMRPTSTRIRSAGSHEGGDHVHLALRRPRRECAADVAVPRARCLATSMS